MTTSATSRTNLAAARSPARSLATLSRALHFHRQRIYHTGSAQLLPVQPIPRGSRTSCGLRIGSAFSRSYFLSHTAVSVPIMDSNYSFPLDKMWSLKDESKTPLVLISCGSFSPITYLHLRMFEMVKDWAKDNTDFEVVAGYLSPVSDAYKKDGLAKAHHRLEMCRRASSESSWIMVDDWEASKSEYTRTAFVLDHFEHEINSVQGGIETPSGGRRKAKVSLMSGADLIQTMSNPGVWAEEDLEHILGGYGAFIIERHGTNMEEALSSLQKWRKDIWCIPQLIQNDVSSTKIRNFLRQDKSIRYLIPEPALTYIDAHQLFRDHKPVDSGYTSPPGSANGANGQIVNGAS